jgi:hypothetical protein
VFPRSSGVVEPRLVRIVYGYRRSGKRAFMFSRREFGGMMQAKDTLA